MKGESIDTHHEIGRPINARLASWLTTSSPATVGYHMSCGLSLPERKKLPHGRGPGWQSRALAALLRECYRRGLENSTLEEVEVVALSVLPAPEQDDEVPRPPLMPSMRERWEEAVCVTAEAVHGILRHGPASGRAGGEILFTGGTLKAEVADLRLEQRVDLIWRRPDGALEAVLVFEEPLGNHGPQPAENDWRCVLAAAVLRELYGETPDVHAVWVSGAAARIAHIPDETLDERLGRLSRVLEDARGFGGLAGTGEGAFYHLADVAGASYELEDRRRRRRPGDSGQRSRG